MKTIVPISSFGEHATRRYPRCIFAAPLSYATLMRGRSQVWGASRSTSAKAAWPALVQGSLALREAVAIDVHFQEQDFKAVAIVRHTRDVRSGLSSWG